MKIRITSLALAVLTCFTLLTACSAPKEYTFEPYTAFDGTDKNSSLQTDSYVTIDGLLDEDIWTESKTKVNIPGATKDQTTKQDIDVTVYGTRSAAVYTYIGEKAIYFAFEVKDKNLYYTSTSPQGRSTCVELYLTERDNTELSKKCFSIRINPTGKDGEDALRIGTYTSNNSCTEWETVTLIGRVKAAVKVNGKVQNTDSAESTAQNVGYVMEIAVDKSLIDPNADEIRFTAAFVQAKGYGQQRLNNSFIGGTSYIRPQSWIIMTNEGARR